MILVFDLDDTLYEEITFVKSGFAAVSKFLSKVSKRPATKIYHALLIELEKNGRGSVFNEVISQLGLKRNKTLTHKCLAIYRLHTPKIYLYKDAVACLNTFKDYTLYIVTDGNKVVQHNKIKALGLENKVKKCFISRRYGIKNEKPSPYCFLKICKLEKVKPSQVAYIADNPLKDFVGIKPLGFKTIRIKRGNYKNLRLAKKYEAHFSIKNLNQLDSKLLKRISK